MASNVGKTNSKSYLAKDFSSFRSDLVTYARNYFSDQIQDFSEAGIGGMFVELAAFVGDTMSFYLDHQFNELNPQTAIEVRNVQNHAKNVGVKVVGAAPAVANVTFYIEVPAVVLSDGTYFPSEDAMPIVKTDTTLLSSTGVSFTLTEDLDFSDRNVDGVLLSSYAVSVTDNSGNPTHYIMTKNLECVSGKIRKDTYQINNVLQPFRKLTLTRPDVTQIINVRDLSGNEYYEVESLAQDTVFTRVQNLDDDRDDVSENLNIIPAPYRYISSVDFTTRLSTIQFGSGDATSTDDDIIADPSDLALPLYGKKTFSTFSIDPNSLLKTRTLGISPVNTTISIEYRYGGGTSHNVCSTIHKVNKHS